MSKMRMTGKSYDSHSRDYGYDSSQGSNERLGADGTRLFVCSVCYRMEVAGYEGWLYHLGTREHQENLRRARCAMNWRKTMQTRRRCLVIKGIEGSSSHEVLEYLKTWGEVEDFQYDFIKGENKKARHCLCLYRDNESANACLNENGSEWNGKKLEIHIQRQERLEFENEETRKARKRKFNYYDSLYYGR